MGLRVQKRGQGPRSFQALSCQESGIPPWVMVSPGQKLLDNSVLATEVSRDGPALFLSSRFSPFSSVTLEQPQLCEGWFGVSRPSLPGISHPRQVPPRHDGEEPFPRSDQCRGNPARKGSSARPCRLTVHPTSGPGHKLNVVIAHEDGGQAA